MNGQLPQQTNPVVPIKISSNFSVRNILIFIGIFMLGSVLGFSARTLISSQKVSEPISPQLLRNPIVYEWRGSVKGKITKKDEHTFTLVDDKGNSITITNITPSGDQWKTVFYDTTNNYKQASYSAIPVGSILRGDFFIFNNGPNTPVGATFAKL